MRKYDRIYSIGCFDGVIAGNFHKGHFNLMKRMRDMLNLNGLLIIGIHDDSSLEKLKNLKPKDHQTTKERMADRKSVV